MNTILLYYKYIHIADPKALLESQRALCERLSLKGRIIIAHEGINGTVEGTKEATDEYIKEMRADPRFVDIHWKMSTGTLDGTAFPKLSIKVRKEIVSAHLDQDVNPTRTTGKRLSADELQKWFDEGRDFAIVDMRNDYEHASGHFKGSILPPLSNFRDLPEVTKTMLDPLKKKTVLSVCTGGVRCEKASGYLIEKGFEDVYQLDGGIVSYMEKYPGKNFKGSLYVFDERKVMTYDRPEEHEVVGRCATCGAESEYYVNCMDITCHKHFISCVNCIDEKGEALCFECLNRTSITKNSAKMALA